MKKIFILSTGGTISMCKTEKGYVPEKGFLQHAMKKLPELSNEDMPDYTIYEWEAPIDSANMTIEKWNTIAEIIFKQYEHFDGFIILHGTDTMSYTASALSFMFENLTKPIILTGSQLPLFETRNDARENLLNALYIAGKYNIPEVCIFFNNKLYRGNRSIKLDANAFEAFASPNFPRLGKVGTEVMIRKDLFKKNKSKPTAVQLLKVFKSAVVRIFPNMSFDFLNNINQLDALILQTYGVGNAPQEKSFLNAINDAVMKNVIIVNASQCPYAKIKMSDYATGSVFQKLGVVSGGDMTVEAILTKLNYLFSKELSHEEIKGKMQENLRGELTL